MGAWADCTCETKRSHHRGFTIQHVRGERLHTFEREGGPSGHGTSEAHCRHQIDLLLAQHGIIEWAVSVGDRWHRTGFPRMHMLGELIPIYADPAKNDRSLRLNDGDIERFYDLPSAIARSLEVNPIEIEIEVRAEHATEMAAHRFVTEASEIGLAPGQWPQRLATKMGNGMPFLLCARDPDGSAIYLQHAGCLQLVVLND